MAKSTNEDLFDRLRKSGLRKRVARTVSNASRAADKRAPKPARRALDDLRSLVGELEHRLSGNSTAERRKAAAAKGARTRRAKAAKGSQAAKKAARTRAGSRG
jgi:hypothetical protein